ncbi:hypothetical protein B0H13DRAFT_2655104 [Mycena leptocephala]|nr:hypothetical protein B0H13DRAFT_2655104 [Mycena leptocephala]
MSSSSFDADSTLGRGSVNRHARIICAVQCGNDAGVHIFRALSGRLGLPLDSRAMKATVALVWCAEFAHAICIGYTIYSMVITNYGHPERLVQLPNSLIVSTVIGSLVSYFIQSFFAYRIYTVSRSLIIPCIY